MNFSDQFLNETVEVVRKISRDSIEALVLRLARARDEGGRVFILGVGGSAASGSHMVNDFRKLANIETYTPTDNVSELTARTNDEGWASVFAEWLKGSRLRKEDVVLILSVGGGDAERNISPNLVEALKYAKQVGSGIVGIVGRQGGYTAQVADACVLVPVVNPDRITPHTESFHSVIGHLIVSHPKLKAAPAKWESAVAKQPN
ncbi:MAG: SIS domain-containing protein [Lentisphaerota bacterium]